MPVRHPFRSLPEDLSAIQRQMEAYAREYGLDFFPQSFEVVDHDQLNAVAAYGGFPTRYPHWRFGMEYEQLSKGYSYGLQKIYELVINNNPCYAYLLASNSITDHKLVIAHVCGHNDFFKNNYWFSQTSRKMIDEMANHGNRIRRYMDRYGVEKVEDFIDACLSIEDQIDIHSPFIQRYDPVDKYQFQDATAEEDLDDPAPTGKFQSKGYMDSFVNPREALEAERDRQRKKREEKANFPAEPMKDLMLFLLQHADLRPWQYDVLSIIRDEAYYFAPQGQTKIMNEGWACLTSGSLVVTNLGFFPIEQIVAGENCRVSDGEELRDVLDRACFKNRETITIHTRRGLVLSGSTTHRVRLADGSWRRLDALQVGDRLERACGTNLWPNDYVSIEWRPPNRTTLRERAAQAGIPAHVVYEQRRGRRGRRADEADGALALFDATPQVAILPQKRQAIRIPEIVDEKLAAILGYLIGDGHISQKKRTIGLTTGDDEQAESFSKLVEKAFGVRCRTVRDGGRWRVKFSSQHAQDFLIHLGLTTGRSAREKAVPTSILRSPASVVAAFLRALFDCDGYAGKLGVILSTSSDKMSEVVQLLLLNFGILSSRRKAKDGCWRLRVFGASAKVFAERIGFGLSRKQAVLQSYLDSHQWFKKQDASDEVVSIERGRGDVYDLTVAQTHRYVAQGLINHNSYWHSTIMTRHGLEPKDVIDYADHCAGTFASSHTRLNPYKLGIELFRDIEDRWNRGCFGEEYERCDDFREKQNWNTHAGLGREKIFEVRRIHNDLTFIDEFLTLDFCRRHKMFKFGYNQDTGYYEIESRAFPEVKQQLLFSLTNMGRPLIYVKDGNYKNRGELYLEHRFNGVELKLSYAHDTLKNLYTLWKRPVYIETVLDNQVSILSFNGTKHHIETTDQVVLDKKS